MRIVRLKMLSLSLAACLAALSPAHAEDTSQSNPMQPSESWEAMRFDVLGDVTPVEDEARLTLEAPFRSHDPAVVPVQLRQPAGAADVIEELTLVIDENPSPVAAVFTMGKAMHPLDMEIRVRVNAYSNIRAVAKVGDDYVMAGRYVRAAGGCSAPAGKDPAAALAQKGQMRVQQIAAEQRPEGVRRLAKLMLRHPNYSGLQRDQVSLLTIPAEFIDVLEVRQGDELLFSLTGGISISEDPVILFHYLDNGAGELSVRAVDTDGAIFQQSFAVEAG